MKSTIEKRNWGEEGDERVCQLTGIIVCSSILNSAMQIFTTPFTRSGILPRWWMFRGSVCLASFPTVLWMLCSSVWIGCRKFDIFFFFFGKGNSLFCVIRILIMIIFWIVKVIRLYSFGIENVVYWNRWL